MHESPSQPDFDDELVSAYLDGELASEELALVEERLRTNPRARRLLEEMRELSAAFKSLPRETLGRDLRDAVRAETDDDALAGQVTPARDWRDSRWSGIRRGLVWSAITIAAALVLMVTQPERPRDADVAAARKPA